MGFAFELVRDGDDHPAERRVDLEITGWMLYVRLLMVELDMGYEDDAPLRPDRSGIPIGALTSHAGSWVTVEQCAAAVRIYDGVAETDKASIFDKHARRYLRGDATELRTVFEEWVDFLRRGAAARGFRVY